MTRKRTKWWIIRSGKWGVAVMSDKGLIFVEMSIATNPHLFRNERLAREVVKRCKKECYTQSWII